MKLGENSSSIKVRYICPSIYFLVLSLLALETERFLPKISTFGEHLLKISLHDIAKSPISAG